MSAAHALVPSSDAGAASFTKQPAPLVYHEALAGVSVGDAVCEALGVDSARAATLVRLGAVWTMDDGKWRRYLGDPRGSHERGAAGKRDGLDRLVNREVEGAGTLDVERGAAGRDIGLDRLVNRELGAGIMPESSSTVSYRIYSDPPRFTEACSLEWESRVLHVDGAYVVVDKPPGLPTQPGNGNVRECVAECCARGAAKSRKLLRSDGFAACRAAHRLDTVVGGCLVLSRNAKAQTAFAKWLSRHKVTKTYIALSRERPSYRSPNVVHEMLLPASDEEKSRVAETFGPGPRILRLERKGQPASPHWRRCRLRIVSCEEVKAAAAADVEGLCYETTVELITGRPHQIRAQMAALGAPLLGDSLYVGGSSAVLLPEEEAGFAKKRREAAARPPTAPIGLSSRRVQFAGRDVRAKAPPWWRLPPK